MKKFLIGASALVMAFALTLGFMTYNKTTASALLLANLEALADSEDTLWNPFCHSGGPGSSACSIEAGITIAGYGVSAACSVNCNSGYYACCGIRCTCKS